MVFRSVAVPIKATIGYLLSVGAAFGVTAMVFEYGWFSSIFNVAQTAPVISFLPILLMGILFGLAMDYEVFLVSRIREEYVHGGDPNEAIEDGFAASSRVVVAAAVIMFAVFAAFVPEGEGPIKTIAFGLAVGVFVDAFVVRMTLVPAVLALLGRAAWWLPRWIDQRLPSFDVEGQGLAHQLALADWPSPNDQHAIYAEELPVGARAFSLAVRARGARGSRRPRRDRSAAHPVRPDAGRRRPGQGRRLRAARASRRRSAANGFPGPRTSTDLRRDLLANPAREIHRSSSWTMPNWPCPSVTQLLADYPGPAVSVRRA